MRKHEFPAAAALLAAAVTLPPASQAQGAFDQCVGRLQAHAIDQGIDSATAERVLSDVTRIERAITADRNQPEFVSTFEDYFERRVTPWRVERGREMLSEHGDLLRQLTSRYGVPGHYLVALWGLETNYGAVLGSTPVFDSLTTMACDNRRSDFFTAELVDALRIVDRGDVAAGKMIGSWAGAMGMTQFMPSSYLAYAVDGDGDGRADLWDVDDALASAANYLRRAGWEPGFRWGREVVLPEGFDRFALAGLGRSVPLARWRSMGLREVGGDPVADLDIEASLLVPSGHDGPAFLVYENFNVIMRWNRSTYFGLAVGVLADRIAGAGRLHNPPPDSPPLTRAQLLQVQQGLNSRGYDSGEPDGMLGPATRKAVRAYQSASGLIADGYVDEGLLQSLGIE